MRQLSKPSAVSFYIITRETTPKNIWEKQTKFLELNRNCLCLKDSNAVSFWDSTLNLALKYSSLKYSSFKYHSQQSFCDCIVCWYGYSSNIESNDLLKTFYFSCSCFLDYSFYRVHFNIIYNEQSEKLSCEKISAVTQL